MVVRWHKVRVWRVPEFSTSHQRDRRRTTERKSCVIFSRFVFTVKIVRAFRAKTVFSLVIMPDLERHQQESTSYQTTMCRICDQNESVHKNHVGLKETTSVLY